MLCMIVLGGVYGQSVRHMMLCIFVLGGGVYGQSVRDMMLFMIVSGVGVYGQSGSDNPCLGRPADRSVCSRD